MYGISCTFRHYIASSGSVPSARHNTPIHNILSTAPQLIISQKALGTFPEDGNVMPKHVGDTIHINKLNELLLHLLVFHAYINEMQSSRSKIPSKKSRQAALRGGI
jgi:hypothetical protein